MVSSGVMSNAPGGPDVPPNNVMSVLMNIEGTFDYVCLLHPQMTGRVTVVADNAAADSQADIDAMAGAGEAALRAPIDGLRAAGEMIQSEAGPDGTTTWHIDVGPAGFDSQLELYEFMAENLTIQEGDTVIWANAAPSIHTVTFHPGIDAPEFVVPEFQEAGPPILVANPVAVFPVKPTGEFEGTGYRNSGIMSALGGPGVSSFSMTFSAAGSFDYICAIHGPLGMEATITVVERTTSVVAQMNGLAAQFPEGLAVDADGALYAGMAPTSDIRKFSADGSSTTYAQLPSPGAGFLLSMDFDANGDMFVTDTIGGATWKIDFEGNVTSWTSDALMLGDIPPGPVGFPLGANGIAFDAAQQNLYVTVPDKSRIVRIPVNGDGSAGTASVFVEDTTNLGGPDGITFGSDGYLYVALVGSDAVVKVAPDGAITLLASGGSIQIRRTSFSERTARCTQPTSPYSGCPA